VLVVLAWESDLAYAYFCSWRLLSLVFRDKSLGELPMGGVFWLVVLVFRDKSFGELPFEDEPRLWPLVLWEDETEEEELA